MSQLPPPPPPPEFEPLPWYRTTWFTVLALVLFFPLGLYLMWLKQPTWARVTKVIVSFVLATVLIPMVVVTAVTAPKTSPAAPFALASPMPSSTSTVTSTPASTPSPPPTVTATTATPTRSPTASPVPTPAPTAAPPLVTGFGATDAAWEANHQADSRFAAGCCYNDDPSLAPVNGHESPPRYFATVHSHGVVVAYEIRLHTGTTIGTARALVAQEFPADFRTTWYAVTGACSQESVTSAAVQRNIVASGYANASDPPYYLAEFSTSNADGTSAWDPGSVTDILLNTTGTASAADAGGC